MFEQSSAVPETGTGLQGRLRDRQAPPRRTAKTDQPDLSAKILAVQNVFTDRRAYVNALTYELETGTSASGKKSKQEDIDEYKKEKATVEFPDGHKAAIQLPETGRDL